MLRILKWIVVIAVVAGSMQWFVRGRADARITQIVADANAKLPMQLDAITTVTKLEYTHRVLRYTAVLAGDHEVTAQRNGQFLATLLDSYCFGAQKAFFLAGVGEEYTFKWNSMSAGPRSTVISVAPAQCLGVPATPAASLSTAQSANSATNRQQPPQRQQPDGIRALTSGTPLEVQPMGAEEQRHALAGNQQCINGNVVEYISATHTFAELGLPVIHCSGRVADDALR